MTLYIEDLYSLFTCKVYYHFKIVEVSVSYTRSNDELQVTGLVYCCTPFNSEQLRCL